MKDILKYFNIIPIKEKNIYNMIIKTYRSGNIKTSVNKNK